MVRLTTETQDVRLPVQFECPHCEAKIDQTKSNRTLPVVECSSCKRPFSTQWAESESDRALPRGLVVSERFEVARNFSNKLWNAARFAMMRMDDYTVGSIEIDEITVEDRWIISRLATVSDQVTSGLETFAYAETARILYEFVWQEFCSFYVEMLKDRLNDAASRPQAQRMLAWALDCILRLLHPIMPFITEEVWQILKTIAPQRGLESVATPADALIAADWPTIDSKWCDPAIENQFALFQSLLGTLREIRARQNIDPKRAIQFSVRCSAEVAEQLRPLIAYLSSLAGANLVAMGETIEVPQPSATDAQPQFEVFVELAGLIDVAAEKKKLEKEKSRVVAGIDGKQKKLANEKFVASAPPEIVQREREGLVQLEEQLAALERAMAQLTVGS